MGGKRDSGERKTRVRKSAVAAHIGIRGNEGADKLTKEATDEEALIAEITKGGLKQK